jgi:HD-GYP domain-containing protein (c-di-GMP phosphodiesterase class II)
MSMRGHVHARTLIAATLAVGAATVSIAALHVHSVSIAALALFGAAVLLMELIEVLPDETSLDPRETTSFTFSASVHIAAVVVLGPWLAALVAAFGVVAADGLRGRALSRVAFNASAAAVAVASGGLVYLLLGGHPGRIDLPGDFGALAALAVVVYCVGALLVSAVIVLHRGLAFAATAREAIGGGLAAAVGEAGLGIGLAIFALTDPWAVLALVPLVFAVYHSHERLVRLRRETANALETFANVVDERDSYTYRHSARVAEYVEAIAEGLRLPARTVAELRWAGRLHDLGKISVDASVLRKPDRLAEDEWEAMRLHPRLSARLLRRFRMAADQATAVEYHHERFDGRGYYGIDPSQIPLAAHFLIVADSYDAMTSDRPYRAGMAPEVALAEIERNAGTQFHPALAKAFVALQRGLDPIGALTVEEYGDLRRLAERDRRRSLPMELPVRPQVVVTGGVVAALVAVAAGVPLLGIPALAVAVAGFGAERFEQVRAQRLAGRLRDELGAHAPGDRAFATIVTTLESQCDLRWLALYSWSETECRGTVELEWSGEFEAPSDAALGSWLLRETETSGALASSGADLGRPEAHLAVPLRPEGTLAGYLIVAARGGIPYRVEQSLLENADLVERFFVALRARPRLPKLELAS